MSATKILSCHCKHEAQDQMYGKTQRAHNETQVKSSVAGQHKWRCTVCQTEKFSYE